MKHLPYMAVLDAVPKTGICVIRKSDHTVLYLNKQAQKFSPDAKLGGPCPFRETDTCGICRLPAMDDGSQAHAIGYDPCYGGVVDITATRVLWKDATPAFAVTIAPHAENSGYTYRKVLHVDLEEDRCAVLKSDPGQWVPGSSENLSRSFEEFARGGAVHPEDVERFVAFTSREHLRAAAEAGQDSLTLIYRRKMGDAYRWNLMEVFPWQGGSRFAVICVKDVHDVLREGLDRVGLTVRGQELVRSLGEQNSDIYTIDLDTGSATPIRVDGVMREELGSAAWESLLQERVQACLHEADRDEFMRCFSLAGLREAKAAGRQKSELLCQWRSGGDYRYVSATAYFGNAPETVSYTVLALQDVDERIRLERANTKRDAQMAAILKSRYQMMNTVHLDTGLCERIDLNRSAGPENALMGDYSEYINKALMFFVHPEDMENFRRVLSLEHLRQKAETVADSGEEICQYRLRGDKERWIELHVLYSRQKDHVMVNILGQDITQTKEQEAAHLQALEDRAYMITSLSSLFFSTYYIELERDTFRAVTQLHRVSDVLGNEVNFTTALHLYAQQFIHPDDRDYYLKTMSIPYLREHLRWWQPYVTVEYRKLPDFPDQGMDCCQWVRATAVLSRVGVGDLPKTAVYVARNISEDERTDGDGE